MNIATHLMTGTIIAAPLFPTEPLTAWCIVFGSVLPDMDATSRLFGKEAFLRRHQTWTHSLVVMAVLTAVGLVVWRRFVPVEPWAPMGLLAGMVVHAAMDWVNTYGVGLWWPVVRRRYAAECIFFIDAVEVTVTVVFCALALRAVIRSGGNAVWPAMGFVAFQVMYGLGRWGLRRRAWRLRREGAVSLLPTAFVPWRFAGYGIEDRRAETYELNALDGSVRGVKEYEVFDEAYAEWLAEVPEYRRMRELSPGYHAVEAVGEGGEVTLVCRDLRTTHFGGKFGMLKVTFDATGKVVRKVFYA